MKNLIKKLLRESLLGEVVINQSNISEDIGLFLLPGNTIVLYDMVEYDDSDRYVGVKGTITIRDENGRYSVNKVAALKGYGPIMYELAMQHVYPKPLISDREGDTRQGAINVVNKFVSGINPNIDVVKLTPGDKYYVDCLDFGCVDSDPEFFNAHNAELSMSDKSLYIKLKTEGDEFLDDVGHEFIDELEDLAGNFFDEMYSTS